MSHSSEPKRGPKPVPGREQEAPPEPPPERRPCYDVREPRPLVAVCMKEPSYG